LAQEITFATTTAYRPSPTHWQVFLENLH